MAGKLYGVGVGPGDPELLTLKAVKIINQCEVIAVPGKEPRKTAAYQIAYGACPKLKEKEIVGIYMPMTKDKEALERSHTEGVSVLKSYLEQERDVAFLTLGDPSVYSTYLYLHEIMLKEGYKAEMINGIPSFCAAAATLNMGLGKREEKIHVIPASYQIEDALKLSGTKVLMKAGKNLADVKAQLKKLEQTEDRTVQVMMVENCGMEEEHIYRGADEIPESAGYYTILFVKEGEMA